MTPLSMFPLAAVLFAGCHASADARPREILVGGPCEGCEAVFEDRPSTLASAARIAPETEPGEPMSIDGVVRRADGTPGPGVIVYAYQTDAGGRYPPGPSATTHRHGRLRGFVRSDAAGRFAFSTIRPGSYPGSNNPQHVHVHVVEPGRCHYYIDDLVFSDDPLLTEAQRLAHAHGRGGPGLATPSKRVQHGKASWSVRRDIVLGAGIADYERCGKR